MNTNEAFLKAINPEARTLILANIAGQYGISNLEAFDEVADPEAFDLVDYLTENVRFEVAALMKVYGFR